MRFSLPEKYKRCLLLTMTLLWLTSASVWALGTPAGTTISNRATLTFWHASTGSISVNSNVTSSRVDELIGVDVTWQDSAPVAVTAGATGQLLTFRVTNTGNGKEQYGLIADPALLGDAFDPTAVKIYLDDGNGVFSLGSDSLYSAASKPNLNPDQALIVFIVSDIPTGLANGLIGQVSLAASSVTFSGVGATILPGFGDLGTTAVRKAGGGEDVDTGSYQTVAPGPDPDPDPQPEPGGLNLSKSVSVTGPGAETEPIPGAILSYQITVRYLGAGTAQRVVISDPIPAQTTYRPGSLRLNGTLLTDGSDSDPGVFNNTNNGAISVNLGDLDETSPIQTITFDVNINP